MLAVVLTTVPDLELGERIARVLVEERLAACVNVAAPMTSIYRWKGAVERETEHQLVIKTMSDRVADLQARLRQLHPYEVPEFVVLHAADAGQDYLEWLRAATAGSGSADTR